MSKPTLQERFAAAFKAFSAKELPTKDGNPDLNEDAVASLEAAAEQLETVKAENATLKDQNQEHATTIADLEAAATTAKDANKAATDKVKATLEKYKVAVAEDADVLAIANDTLVAWAKKTANATSTQTTETEDLGDGKPNAILCDVDEELAQIKGKMEPKTK